MTTIKKHDFVEIEYTGRIKEDNTIFDTSEEKVAKEERVYDKSADYSPVIISVGENYMLKSLEDQMIGKEIGKEYSFEIDFENAFGKKDAKLIQLIPTSKFKQEKIEPFPGLQLNIDGVFGIIKTVSGGRCMVDFNHPLAGKDLIYNVKINKIVEDNKEKIKSLLKMHLKIKDAEIELKEESSATELNKSSSQLSAEIKSKHNVPKESIAEFKKIVAKTIPNIKNIDFTVKL